MVKTEKSGQDSDIEDLIEMKRMKIESCRPGVKVLNHAFMLRPEGEEGWKRFTEIYREGSRDEKLFLR